jgi:hypothetical protein
MELAKARPIAETLIETLVGLYDIRDGTTREIASTEKMLRELVVLVPELAGLVAAALGSVESPRGMEAVKRILTEHPRQWFTVGRMVEELTKRGWTPDSDEPNNATRAALDRLVAADPENYRKSKKVIVSQEAGVSRSGIAYGYNPGREPF